MKYLFALFLLFAIMPIHGIDAGKFRRVYFCYSNSAVYVAIDVRYIKNGHLVFWKPVEIEINTTGTEHPIRTLRRIKKELRKNRQSIFVWVGWGLWLLAIILFTIWQGWLWLLWFAAGCVVLLVLVEGINSLLN